MKKIVEVPDNATEVAFFDGTSALGFGLKVNELENAPEKRVVELPSDVINQFETAKEQSLSVFDFLMYKFTVPNDVIVTNNRLANWYLGHIDFVPKEEN